MYNNSYDYYNEHGIFDQCKTGFKDICVKTNCVGNYSRVKLIITHRLKCEDVPTIKELKLQS